MSKSILRLIPVLGNVYEFRFLQAADISALRSEPIKHGTKRHEHQSMTAVALERTNIRLLYQTYIGDYSHTPLFLEDPEKISFQERKKGRF